MYEIESEKGEEKTLLRTLESIPVLAKSGAILPLSEEKGNGTPNPRNLTVKIFAGNGEYEMYEDAHDRNEDGEFFTKFVAREKLCENGYAEQSLEITSHGDESVVPAGRKMRLCFEGAEKGEITLKINKKATKVQKIYADRVTLELDFSAGAKYEIVVKYKRDDKFTAWKKRATKILTECDGNNRSLAEANKTVQALSGKNRVESFLAFGSDLESSIAERLKETL